VGFIDVGFEDNNEGKRTRTMLNYEGNRGGTGDASAQLQLSAEKRPLVAHDTKNRGVAVASMACRR
jgi:hypothetical protein